MMGAWFWLNIPLAAPIFGESPADQGSGRSPSSRRSRPSTLWPVQVFCETRQLATGSQRD
jgi:hypothetical protein